MYKTILLATTNAGKISEFRALFASLPYTLKSQADFDVLPAEETGLSFVENAILKARHVAKHTALPVIADDSGLIVPALHGAPGIYSARYAGVTANDEENRNKLLADMSALPDAMRTAYFYCVLVFMQDADDPAPLICDGRIDGMITKHALGDEGFGYDPIFYIPSLQKTAAQVSSKIKNTLSHRAVALKKLITQLPDYL